MSGVLTRMTLSSWGIAMDVLGVLLIAAGSATPVIKNGMMTGVYRMIDDHRWRRVLSLSGWSLLATGFVLMFFGSLQ